MAGVEAIVVGGGIESGSPFALGQLVYISNVNPPQLTSYPPKRVLDGAVVVTSVPNNSGTYNAITGATETLRVQGGMIVSGSGTDTVQIGRGATATANQSTVIGTGAKDNSQVGVVVGTNAAMSAAAGVVIGNGAALSGNAGSASGIAIGTGAIAANSSSGGGDSLAIGNGAVASQGDTVIGFNATSSTQNVLGNGNVVIGSQANVNVGQGASTAVGASSGIAAKAGVAIGQGATIGTGINNVVIGQVAKVNGAAADCIVIGQNSVLSSSQSIAIGVGAVDLGANVCQLGAPTTDIRTFVLGAGDTIAAPAARTLRFTNGLGANNAAGNVTIIAPLSTGNAAPGTVIIQVGRLAGSSSTLQTATTMLTIGDNKLGFFAAAPVAQQVSGGTAAGAIAGLVALGLFSS